MEQKNREEKRREEKGREGKGREEKRRDKTRRDETRREEKRGRGAEPAGQMRDEKLHAVVARSTFRSQNAQNTSRSDRFWKLRCRKSARRFGAKHISTQNAQNRPGSDHFWKLRCRKSARRSGGKHISKSKCTKHLTFRPLLEVAMSKKCTPLWREAHFHSKCKKKTGSDHFWKLRCRKSVRRCGAQRVSKSK